MSNKKQQRPNVANDPHALPALPEKDPRDKNIVSTGFKLPAWLLDRLTEIAGAEGYSRNGVVRHFLKWAVARHDEMRPRKNGSD